SNSLLEAAVMGLRAGRAIASEPHAAMLALASKAKSSSSSLPYVRSIVSGHLGLLRDEEGLRSAITALLPLAQTDDAAAVALIMSVAAFERCETRGSHARTDFPGKAAATERSVYTFEQSFALAREIALPEPLSRIA